MSVSYHWFLPLTLQFVDCLEVSVGLSLLKYSARYLFRCYVSTSWFLVCNADHDFSAWSYFRRTMLCYHERIRLNTTTFTLRVLYFSTSHNTLTPVRDEITISNYYSNRRLLNYPYFQNTSDEEKLKIFNRMKDVLKI